MKTLGLIGGMSWESTITYYQVINRTVKEKLGGLHSARCIVFSVDFQEIEDCQARGDWERSARILSAAARSLEAAGAECLAICTNTMHKVAETVESAVSIPLLHVAEMTADELARNGIDRVGLLGTKYTMEQDFYKRRLVDRGIEVLIPDDDARRRMNEIVYEELCLGTLLPASRDFVLGVIEAFRDRGAGGVILGCTEIGLLVRREDTTCPLFDTALIHARGAALYALE